MFIKHLELTKQDKRLYNINNLSKLKIVMKTHYLISEGYRISITNNDNKELFNSFNNYCLLDLLEYKLTTIHSNIKSKISLLRLFNKIDEKHFKFNLMNNRHSAIRKLEDKLHFIECFINDVSLYENSYNIINLK